MLLLDAAEVTNESLATRLARAGHIRDDTCSIFNLIDRLEKHHERRVAQRHRTNRQFSRR
jgi:hypothetical protein